MPSTATRPSTGATDGILQLYLYDLELKWRDKVDNKGIAFLVYFALSLIFSLTESG